MKVLIAGAGGQVGRALAAAAPEALTVLAATRTELDITDRAGVDSLVNDFGPELIINAAAYTAVDNAESEPEAAYRINDLGARNLAEAAAAANARLIHISTDFVFDGTQCRPYAPAAEPAPLGVYGASKLAGEKSVLASLPGRALILRTAWVYAATGHNFVLTMLRLMRERGAVRVVCDQIGSPTAAASIATAIWAFTLRPEISGIYHWSDAGVASWYDFAVAIAEEAAGCGLLPGLPGLTPIMTEEYPTPARRPGFSVLDTRASIDAIGIQPPHWRASLRRVLGIIERG